MSLPLILITGATGFIGSHVVHQALSAGHKVRLSVRKESQIDTLRKLFSEHSPNLDFAIISDFTGSDRFSKALEDVTYVFHLASPMPGKGSNFQTDYLAPAVQGTLALLNAAKEVDTIKRVVIVSSIAAFMPLGTLTTGSKDTIKEGINLTIPVEANMAFLEDPRSGLKYHASKILAHRSTLDWASAQNHSFSIITLHPSFVFGRNMLQTSAEGLDGTNAMLWACLHAPKTLVPLTAVDVRDVAAAHVAALHLPTSEEGHVEEFILSAGPKEHWTWEQVANFARSRYPALGVKLEGPFDAPPEVETQRAERILGLKWRGMEDTVGDFLDQQVELRGV